MNYHTETCTYHPPRPDGCQDAPPSKGDLNPLLGGD